MNSFKLLGGYFRRLLEVLKKAGCYLSQVWFLFPVVSYFSFIGAFKNMQDSPAKTDYWLGIFCWTWLIYIIASLFLIYRKKTVQFCLSAVVGFVIFLAAGFLGLALQSAPTTFAEEHPIPKGLIYNTPKAEDEEMEEEVNPSDTTTYLQVRRSSEGGIYEYSFFYPDLPEGTIYLKCFEVTENLPLSKRRLKKASKQEVKGTNHFACLVKRKRFTIYEGDWGKYYAARIEVWFRDKKGNERKLSEKVYAVEGWMR